MVGTLISAGIGVASSIAGGIAASRAAKKAADKVEAQRLKNQEWYNRRYNENATQRADAQQMLTQTQEAIRQRNKAAAGAQAVMGGTSESVAAEKAANAQAISNAASNIAANAAAQKDNIEATYMQNDNAFNEQQAQIERDRANAIAEATKGVASTTSAIAGGFMGADDFGTKKNKGGQ